MIKHGKQHGLRITLDVGKRSDYDSISPSIGIRVFIYNHSTLYSDSEGFDVSIAKETNIVLTKHVSKSIREPYSDCVIDFDNKVNEL